MANSFIQPQQLQEGDVLEVPGKYPFMKTQGSTYVYVHEIQYDPRFRDHIVGIVVLEIVNQDYAEGIQRTRNYPFVRLQHDEVTGVLGIRSTKPKAVLIAREEVQTSSLLGQNGRIKKIANILGQDLHHRLSNMISGQPTAQELRLAGVGPINRLTQNLGIATDITPRRIDEDERTFRERKFKPAPAKKGQIMDLELDHAVTALSFDKALAEVLKENGIVSLRQAFTIASNDPERIKKYAQSMRGEENNSIPDSSLTALTVKELEELHAQVKEKIRLKSIEEIKNSWEKFKQDFTAIHFSKNPDGSDIYQDNRLSILDRYKLAADKEKPAGTFMDKRDARYLVTDDGHKTVIVMRNQIRNNAPRQK